MDDVVGGVVVVHYHTPSPPPQYLAYSDAHKLRAYQLHTNTAPHPPTPPRGTPPHPPTRLSLNTESLGTLCALCFTGDGKHLLTADVQGTVSLLSLPQGGALGGALVCQWDQLRLAAARGPGAPTGFDMRAAATAALGGAGGGGDPLGPRPVSLLAASADGRYDLFCCIVIIVVPKYECQYTHICLLH